MGKTTISWTDRTWNPIIGCDRISPGCKNCYAKSLHDMRHKAKNEGKLVSGKQYDHPFETIQILYNRFQEPLSWRKPQKVFVNSMGDLFHRDVPTDQILVLFGIMSRAPQHTFQILTKRPERMKLFMKAYFPDPIPNVHLGVTVENQRFADERVQLLQGTPAAVRFISQEPQLEQIIYKSLEGIHQIIVGCESGPGRRPAQEEWFLTTVVQCIQTGTGFFMKQMEVNGKVTENMEEFPEQLRTRMAPTDKKWLSQLDPGNKFIMTEDVFIPEDQWDIYTVKSQTATRTVCIKPSGFRDQFGEQEVVVVK